MDEFAVLLVFNVDNTPFVCTCPNHFSIDIESLLRTYNGERDFILTIRMPDSFSRSYLDLSVESTFFLDELIIIVWVHFEIMESKFGFDLNVSFMGRFFGIPSVWKLDALREWESPTWRWQERHWQHQTISLTQLCRLASDYTVSRDSGEKIRVSRGLDEEETAMDTRILDISITLSGELLP